jgi:hypothetical protein
MPKHLYLLFILTFILGFASGGYLYFFTRGIDTVEEGPQDGYEVVAYAYGGCERLGCASYRIRDDGSYTYLPRAGAGDRFDDALSKREEDELFDLISGTDFDDLLDSTFIGTCPAHYDGLAYRFEVRVEADRYSYDSCKEAVEEFPLFLRLIKLFDIMEVTHK